MTRHCLSLPDADKFAARPMPPASLAPTTATDPDVNRATAAPAPRAGNLPIHDARALTGAAGQATILLGDQAYTLRITRAGKLILTK